jgi:LacI family transcriptional regulator
LGRGSITIEDVARSAGVSRQTVSRVINQASNVSTAARERVEAAIEELGYVPNLAARRMGGARSFVIVALIERGAAHAEGEHLPLGEMLLAGIETCAASGYHLLFEQIDGSIGEGADFARRLIPVLGAVQPDGVIVMPPLDESLALREALARRGVATAYLGMREEYGRKVPGLDEALFGEAAAQRLVDLGHRQLGFVAGMSEPGRSRLRIEGYRRCLARAGSRAHRHFVAAEPQDFAAAITLARSWLMPTIRPTAIIAETPEVALAFQQVAGEMKLSVPRDLSLICLADSPMLARAKPAISALHQPYPAMFAQACARLMAGSGNGTPTDQTAPPTHSEFVERASITKAPRAV